MVAFGGGGAAEIVRGESAAQPTGVLFDEQSPEALLEALRRFEQDPGRFAPEACRENALRFDRARFRQRFQELLETHWTRFSRGLAGEG